MRSHAFLSILPALLLAAGCSEGAARAFGDGGPADPGAGGTGGLGDCATDEDCPAGLICSADRRCVADDGVPPEEEETARGAAPAASARHLWVLAPDADALTLIDGETLALLSLPVPAEPIDVAVLPGEEAALVLSGAGRALSLVSFVDGAPAIEVLDTGRRFDALALAPDGSVALLWTPDGRLPEDGAEGLVGLVDVGALRAGADAAVATFAAGRRHQAVVFRSEGAEVVEAIVVGKDEIAIFDLRGDAFAAPVRIALDDAFTDPATREVVAAPDGSFLLIRSLASAGLAIFDAAARTFAQVELPAAATDLDVSADGSLAVAVMRTAGQVATIPLPDALGDPGAIAFASVELPGQGCEEPPCVHAPGQATLAPDGSFALLFSNAAPTESFARFDPADGSFVVFDRLEKRVETIVLSPDGGSAVVLHRPDPDSTAADPYERAVDAAHGHAVIDLVRGVGQLKLTGELAPIDVVFAEGGRFAAVPLRDDASGGFGLDAIDLDTLVVQSLPLASAPRFSGPLPAPTPELAHRVWITQEHPAGRIGIAALDAMRIRTITGFALETEVR